MKSASNVGCWLRKNVSRRLFAQVVVDAPDGEVHTRQLPGGGVRFLPVHRDFALARVHVELLLVGVFLDEPLRLHKAPPRPAARVIHAPPVRLQHLHDERHETGVLLG